MVEMKEIPTALMTSSAIGEKASNEASASLFVLSWMTTVVRLMSTLSFAILS